VPPEQLADVLGVGMTTPVGRTAAATAAAIRAGIVRVRESPFRDPQSKPVLAGFLDDEYLPGLAVPEVSLGKAGARYSRMIRLAGLALAQLNVGALGPVPLLLAAPESSGDHCPALLEHVAKQASVSVDLRISRVFPVGRAGGLLDALWNERRLFVQGLSDGFIPGEGAGFVLLGRRGVGSRLGLAPLAQVLGTGAGIERGHLYSGEPHFGDGLADAFRAAFASSPNPPVPVRCVYAGLTGESFWAKEWGVAHLRNAKHFAEGVRIEHPVECIGDAGAALAPIMLGLATIGIARGYRPAPCLIWCGSDREQRAAVLLGEAEKPVRSPGGTHWS
jgi:3-oxoacyl-[acyl-carrier-protein] synthase I